MPIAPRINLKGPLTLYGKPRMPLVIGYLPYLTSRKKRVFNHQIIFLKFTVLIGLEVQITKTWLLKSIDTFRY